MTFIARHSDVDRGRVNYQSFFRSNLRQSDLLPWSRVHSATQRGPFSAAEVPAYCPLIGMLAVMFVRIDCRGWASTITASRASRTVVEDADPLLSPSIESTTNLWLTWVSGAVTTIHGAGTASTAQNGRPLARAKDYLTSC